ncbi:MAG: glycosyltransferase family 4 protein, partial [Deltaproteobacteria bacterium]|nr:glycosyltransferase family 4 protein [Deltaproteobacteria bacterium]
NAQPWQDIHRTDYLQNVLKGERRKIIIYPGRLTHGRGLMHLIESAQYLNNSVIVLMGRAAPNYSTLLSEWIRDLHVERKVFILPPVAPNRVHYVLCSAHIGVMPTENVCRSYQLGAGNKLFHFISAGLPVAVSDQPEKRKIVLENGIGLVFNPDDPRDIFNPDDPRDIAEKLNEIANNTSLYSRLAHNSRNLARKLNWEAEAKKLLDVYQQITEGT